MPKLKKRSLKHSNTPHNLIAIVVVLAVAILGAYLLKSIHAATPYSTAYGANGVLTSPAATATGGSNSKDQAVTFGSSGTGSNGCGTTPALPGGITGAFAKCETGAQIYSDSNWQKSTSANLEPSSGCSAYSPATITVSGTYLDLYTPAADAWDCAGVEWNTIVGPGHIFQLREYIPAAANGDLADYPAFWMTNPGAENPGQWFSEIDMAEAHSWGDTSPIPGQMCLDMHLNNDANSTSPNCQTEAGGWHVYTCYWQANGTVTMYYDSTQINPQGISGSTYPQDQIIIWNDNNGGSGTVNSTVQVDYFAEWNLN